MWSRVTNIFQQETILNIESSSDNVSN